MAFIRKAEISLVCKYHGVKNRNPQIFSGLCQSSCQRSILFGRFKVSRGVVVYQDEFGWENKGCGQ